MDVKLTYIINLKNLFRFLKSLLGKLPLLLLSGLLVNTYLYSTITPIV